MATRYWNMCDCGESVYSKTPGNDKCQACKSEAADLAAKAKSSPRRETPCANCGQRSNVTYGVYNPTWRCEDCKDLPFAQELLVAVGRREIRAREGFILGNEQMVTHLQMVPTQLLKSNMFRFDRERLVVKRKDSWIEETDLNLVPLGKLERGDLLVMKWETEGGLPKWRRWTGSRGSLIGGPPNSGFDFPYAHTCDKCGEDFESTIALPRCNDCCKKHIEAEPPKGKTLADTDEEGRKPLADMLSKPKAGDVTCFVYPPGLRCGNCNNKVTQYWKTFNGCAWSGETCEKCTPKEARDREQDWGIPIEAYERDVTIAWDGEDLGSILPNDTDPAIRRMWEHNKKKIRELNEMADAVLGEDIRMPSDAAIDKISKEWSVHENKKLWTADTEGAQLQDHGNIEFEHEGRTWVMSFDEATWQELKHCFRDKWVIHLMNPEKVRVECKGYTEMRNRQLMLEDLRGSND